MVAGQYLNALKMLMGTDKVKFVNTFGKKRIL